MKAIETQYGGYRFRSRLEARWAVFFDAVNVRWEYEVQGFDFGPPLGRYLPDFWLPDLKIWVEIKGEIPTEEERALSRSLRDGKGRAVWLIHGLPGEFWGTLYCFDVGDSGGGASEWDATPATDDGVFQFQIECWNHDLFSDPICDIPIPFTTMDTGGAMEMVYAPKAKSARFEYGESGAYVSPIRP